jgi:hypothetical protein
MSTPDLAVVIPLEDPRGDISEHLRTWTQSQTLPRERFQMVLGADGRHPEFERQMASELAPQDEVVSAPGASLMGLYDAAARGATAPLLVLTEAHVRAEPGCLGAVAEAFAADKKLDVATLTNLQTASSGISPLSKRWLEQAYGEWERAGWMRVSVTGFAIRGDAYTRAGGLDSRLGTFASSLLSARLDDQGARSTHLDQAVLSHEVEDEMGYALELGGDYARGGCIVRREEDPEFCERYFGPAGLWGRRHAYRDEVARPMVAALRSAIAHNRRDTVWLARELAVRLPARVAGPRPRWTWERITARAHHTVAAASAVPDGARWRSYATAQEANFRAVQLAEAAKENGMPPAPAGGAIAAERLDGLLIGTHALEEQGGQTFRWTEPVALLRLAPPAEGAVLRVETAGVRGAPLDYLQGAYVGSMPLPREQIAGDDEALEIRLPARFARAAADSGLVLISRPLVPSRDGSSDRRRLGIPVVDLELSPA